MRLVRGQLLAIGATAALVAAQHLLRPTFDQAVYMLFAAGLLVCTLFGGSWSVMTASLLLAASGFGVETLKAWTSTIGSCGPPCSLR